MIRRATDEDLPAVHAVLRRNPTTTMFLRSNLLEHGLHGKGDAATTLYVAQSGPEDGMFGLTESGYLMACAPDAPSEMWRAFAQAITGRRVLGMTGLRAQVDAMLTALDAETRAFQLRRDEPLYALDLNNLIALDGDLRRPIEAELDQLIDWNVTYAAEALGTGTGDEAKASAASRIQAMRTRDFLRVLYDDGTPVAQTAFNAAIPDTVQIGGVFTLPEHRRKGYARRAVSLHLQEARALGVTQAILFAANAHAAKAYEAIGFIHVGSYHLALFQDAIEVDA